MEQFTVEPKFRFDWLALEANKDFRSDHGIISTRTDPVNDKSNPFCRNKLQDIIDLIALLSKLKIFRDEYVTLSLNKK